jgi:hypothetical protein
LLYFHVQPKVDASYGGLKATKIPIPKVHIKKEKNIIMKKTLKTNVEWVLCGD